MVKLEVNPEEGVQFTNSYQFFQSSRIFLYNASNARLVFKMCTTRDDRFTFLPEGGFIDPQRGKTVTIFFKAVKGEKMGSANCYCSILAKELPNSRMASMFWDTLINNDEGERFPLKITFVDKPTWRWLSPTASKEQENSSSESMSSEECNSDQPLLRNAEGVFFNLKEKTAAAAKSRNDSNEEMLPLVVEEPSTSSAIPPTASDCLLASSIYEQEIRKRHRTTPDWYTGGLKPTVEMDEEILNSSNNRSQEKAKDEASWIEGEYDFTDEN
ncbi:Major sperm protein [Trichuris trichiura]|uniref:Major sperm protein n=1 Tax=Trichuris trichiura TaxID=36087 RepID=A0A077Z9U1_TRITR|nr:Major sperm protein [Trichuris trichiura]